VLINLKNFLLRPYIMGRSLHMNEALIFISIMIATILEGIMGALLIVPLLASVIVVYKYLQRRILELPPFAEGDSRQFSPPADKLQPQDRIPKREKKKNS
ncbi:MAG: AI-2E family transporter, partial [Anaerolineales bacterium]|nr:AI-2E family transporter [Anaerolineales bacterium]